MKHFEPDDFLRLGKRPSDSPVTDPPGFPKRQKLEAVEDLYLTMVALKSQYLNAVTAWRNSRNGLGFINTPEDTVSEN
jgi:hypothetical protein